MLNHSYFANSPLGVRYINLTTNKNIQCDLVILVIQFSNKYNVMNCNQLNFPENHSTTDEFMDISEYSHNCFEDLNV